MENLNHLLLQRKKELEQLMHQIENELKNLPEGRLRITHKQAGNHAVQYYHCRNKAERNGVYLAQSELAIANDLAKKGYLLKLKNKVMIQLEFLKKSLPDLTDKPFQQVFKNLSSDRKLLITPLIPDDETFIRQWQNIEYEGLPFEPGTAVINTERGERVRSKSEKILADKFYKMGIPYHYEMPIHIPRYGDRYPDFTLLNKRNRKTIYWEHYGKMDDEKYVNQNIKKMNVYTKAGIIPGKNLIMTFETVQQPLDIKAMERLINEFLL